MATGTSLESSEHKALNFGGFTLDRRRGVLLHEGVEVHLRPQSFAVLRLLAENAGRLVTKGEILSMVWGETVVTDDSLTQCLIDIRRALGDGSRAVIRTVPRRGYIFELPVQPSGGVVTGLASAAAVRPQLPRRWLAAGLAVVAVAVLVWWGVSPRVADVLDGPAAPPNSIAVLAFVDMSEGRDHEYFADGISEEILNLLTRIPDLRVVARTSSFSYKGKDVDIATIAEALDVAFVLEGSVRRADDRVRVTAQLVDAASSAHVWSETYDRALDDLLAVQTDIAESVARSLRITLADGSLAGATRAVNPEVYEHYLHGRFLHNRRAPGDAAAAEEHFREAVRIDPAYGPGWAALSGVYLVRIYEDNLPPEQQFAKMREAVTRALALDPSSAEVQIRAAHYYWHVGDPDNARPHWERAQALGHNNSLVLGSLAGVSTWRGDPQRAVEFQRRAVELDPLNFVTRANLSRFLIIAGQYEDAAREQQRARELNPAGHGMEVDMAQLLFLRGRHDEALEAYEALPEGPDREHGFALVHYAQGRHDEADAMVERLRARDDSERALRLAEIHAQRGELDEAFTWLAIARDVSLATALTPADRLVAFPIVESFLLQPLRSDPRWADFVRKDLRGVG